MSVKLIKYLTCDFIYGNISTEHCLIRMSLYLLNTGKTSNLLLSKVTSLNSAYKF